MTSPIIYFGGKNVLGAKMINYMPRAEFDTYVEPFGGSFGFGFRVAEKYPSVQRIYNDLNKDVYTLFKVLSNESSFNEFSRRINLMPYHETIRKEMSISLQDKDCSEIDRAIAFFYTNRTSVNGIGGFSVPNFVRNGMNKSLSSFLGAVEGLPEIWSVMRETVIYCRDAFDIIEKYGHKEKCFLYIDPPYHHESRSLTRYKHDLDNEGQDRLLELLPTLKAKVMLSGYACPTYDSFFSKQEDRPWTRIELKSHSVNGTGVVNNTPEILWTNYNPQYSNTLY